MPEFSEEQLSQMLTAARHIAFAAPRETVADFAARTIPLDAGEQARFFADPANIGQLADSLSEERDRLLSNEGRIPPFAVLVGADRPFEISGLGTALGVRDARPALVSRLEQHERIAETLRGFSEGSQLEAVAAAIIASACDYGSATKGSGDQGIDAIGWKIFLPILPEICVRPHKRGLLPPYPWERIMVIASSKAQVAASRRWKLINPAHFRELIGAWTIQRSGTGAWTTHVLPLSPIQLVMATTYRVSAPARAECRELGVQIWALPELVYLICEFGPDSLFPPDGTGTFHRGAFRRWWRAKDATRIVE